MSVCLVCAEELHEFCENKTLEGCCCGERKDETPAVATGVGDRSGKHRPDSFNWTKDDATVKDQKSTGRKRAAKLFPLAKDEPCEWRELKFAGGGMIPIVGCKEGLQQNRHHGPILLTLANYDHNVHRICAKCHQAWHNLNDPFVRRFLRTVMWRPHDWETKADDVELTLSEAFTTTGYAKDRLVWKQYDKSKDSYQDLLDEIQESGEPANEWFGY